MNIKNSYEVSIIVDYIIYHYSTLGQCRMYFDLSQICPKVAQCDDAPKSCECCTPELHVECNFASSLRSTEHSDHEAYMQHIYALPSHKPAGNFLLQITAKRYKLTIAITGNEFFKRFFLKK